MSPDTDAVALVHRFYEAMNTARPEIIEDVATNVLATDWSNEPAAPGQAPGAVGFRSFVPWLRSSWPDFHISHHEMIVSADATRVAVRSTSEVTHSTDAFFGLPPTGRTASYGAFDVHHIEDGRIHRSFHVEDFLGLAMQLGAQLSPTE